MKLEHKILSVTDLKLFSDVNVSDASPNGEFSAYASTWNNVDRQNEAVMKGAFASSLDHFKANGFIAVGHDWSALPIATIVEAKEDDTGLFIRAEFHSTQAAQDARRVMTERLERGKSALVSIGYKVKKDSRDAKGTRLLHELELHEVSFVTVPANPLAVVTGAKGINANTAETDLADLLEEEGKFDHSLLAGLKFADHTEEVLAANDAWVKRASDVINLRLSKQSEGKAGRSLSQATKTRLTDMLSQIEKMRDTLNGLLDLAKPKTNEDDEEEIAASEDAHNAGMMSLTVETAPGGKGEETAPEQKSEEVGPTEVKGEENTADNLADEVDALLVEQMALAAKMLS